MVFAGFYKHFLGFWLPRTAGKVALDGLPYEGLLGAHEGFILATKVSSRRFHSSQEGFIPATKVSFYARRFHSAYEGFILRKKVSFYVAKIF